MTDKNVNLAELSDDEIINLDPSQWPDTANESESAASEAVADSPAEPEEASDETDGAVTEETSAALETESSTEASAEEDEETSTEAQPARTQPFDQADHQSPSEQKPGNDQEKASPDEINYEAEYKRLMAPFKAAKREIKLDNIDDARRLMQMGVDYSRKMEAMKPYQRVLKTLEKNDLLDIDKVNFLIDLDKKNPEAIKKLLGDSEIDPLDLSLEDDNPYRPTDHSIGEGELALGEVLDEIRGTPGFERTITAITNELDTASKRLLMDNPRIITLIHDHIEGGIYDQIMERVANERLFGRLSGLSDLEAYKAVGDAIMASGGFQPNQSGPSPARTATQDPVRDSGSKDLKDRKRAASPTKGSASGRKAAPNVLSMSDEDIEKLDWRSL